MIEGCALTSDEQANLPTWASYSEADEKVLVDGPVGITEYLNKLRTLGIMQKDAPADQYWVTVARRIMTCDLRFNVIQHPFNLRITDPKKIMKLNNFPRGLGEEKGSFDATHKWWKEVDRMCSE
ncbi:MAG: hypothetical protein OEZ43_21010 [Gammaproteobacteria bacterium]|nr:hypothetical protein [Gammaproteobacteria bacterium]